MRGNETFFFQGPGAELEVEHVVRETFSRAFMPQARAAYDGLTPYAAYLFRIARNILVDGARQRARQGQPTFSGELPELDSFTPSAAELTERAELKALVQEFLQGRPELEQRVYRARFVDGKTQEETARELGVLRIRVRRAEARFKEAFVRFLARKGWLEGMKPGGTP